MKPLTRDELARRDYELVKARWPLAFDLDNPKPLRIGIHNPVRRKMGWSPRRNSRFFRWYTNREEYHFALLEQGNKRYGLNGEEYQEIVEKHMVHAVDELKAINEKGHTC